MPSAYQSTSLAALNVLLVDDEQGFVDVMLP